MIKEKMKGSEGITVVENGITYYAKPENLHSKMNIDFNIEDIWCSYNDNGDFHIVPEDETLNLFLLLKEKLRDIAGKLPDSEKTSCYFEKQKGIMKGGNEWICSFGSEPYTKNHEWLAVSMCGKKCDECRKNETEKYENCGIYEYLLSFNRLWCDADNHIHNNFGQVLFARYRRKAWTVNCVNGGFQMMYPSSGEDGEGRFDRDSRHLVYNAPFDITRDAKAIAKAFAEFIDLCEIMDKEREKP